jgi:hypothetical protein
MSRPIYPMNISASNGVVPIEGYTSEALVHHFINAMTYFTQLRLHRKRVHHRDTEDTERTGFSLWWEIPPKGKVPALRAKSSDD